MAFRNTIQFDSPPTVASIAAIQSGNISDLCKILIENPELVTVGIVGKESGESIRSLLHVATDWPGHFPNCCETIRVLLAAGADVNVRFVGFHSETPLHWAASTDDVDALDVLLDAGADIEADGSVIGNGTALDDAVAFRQWKAARRLVERGARMKLWNAAALGFLDKVQELTNAEPPPDVNSITQAFWCACHGAAKNTAEFLLEQGAELNWVGYDELTPLGAARRAGADYLATWLESQGAKLTN